MRHQILSLNQQRKCSYRCLLTHMLLHIGLKESFKRFRWSRLRRCRPSRSTYQLVLRVRRHEHQVAILTERREPRDQSFLPLISQQSTNCSEWYLQTRLKASSSPHLPRAFWYVYQLRANFHRFRLQPLQSSATRDRERLQSLTSQQCKRTQQPRTPHASVRAHQSVTIVSLCPIRPSKFKSTRQESSLPRRDRLH